MLRNCRDEHLRYYVIIIIIIIIIIIDFIGEGNI